MYGNESSFSKYRLRCMRIFAGVPQRGRVKLEWGCRRRQFWRFRWLLR